MSGNCRKSQGTLYWLALSIESVEEERKKKRRRTRRRDFYVAGIVTLVLIGMGGAAPP
jgi:hypothetical protein